MSAPLLEVSSLLMRFQGLTALVATVEHRAVTTVDTEIADRHRRGGGDYWAAGP